MIEVTGNRIRVETRTLSAELECGAIVSLIRKTDGREFVDRSTALETPPLELVFAAGDVAPLGGRPADRVSCRRLNDLSAEVRFEAWNGDGVLAVAEDAETGDLVVEPSAYSSRPGLRACRWTVGGLGRGLELVAPLFQGVRLPLDDPLIAGNRWTWPHQWEAGLAILRGDDGGMWLHCRDDRYRFKALQVGSSGGPVGTTPSSGRRGPVGTTPSSGRRGPGGSAASATRRLGFDTEVYGPLDRNLAAGGLAWRLNTYEGDWQVPAASYRGWLRRAYGLDGARRPGWLEDLRLALSWCPCEPGILEALAKVLAPERVLLHVPNWRTDPYDENYPTYAPSERGRAFIERAQSTGFHVMPHFNSVDMDPTHPVYALVRDFQYRDPVTKGVQGWTHYRGEVLPVPESNAARLRHRDKKTMVKIHPGLAMWRSILSENVAGAAEDLGLEAAFLDVTLCAWNLDNCLVEHQTSVEGMKRLIARVASLGDGLAVGGEGRNEITMQGQSLAQAHLFRSWQSNSEGLERTGGCPLNEFLFGDLCRSFGYSHLDGKTPESALRMRAHVSLGAVPTVTVRSAAELEQPNEAVKEMLDLATA